MKLIHHLFQIFILSNFILLHSMPVYSNENNTDVPSWDKDLINKAAKNPEIFMDRVKFAWETNNTTGEDFINIVTGMSLKSFSYGRIPCDECGKGYMINMPPKRMPNDYPYSITYEQISYETIKYKKTEAFIAKINFLRILRKAYNNTHKPVVCLNLNTVIKKIGYPHSKKAYKGRDNSFEKFTYNKNDRDLNIYFPYKENIISKDYNDDERNNICADEISFAVRHHLLDSVDHQQSATH